jgi:hypothetical protein
MAHIRRHPMSPDRWQVRYIDPSGRERSRNFSKKSVAEKFLHSVEADKLAVSGLILNTVRSPLASGQHKWKPQD